MKQNENLKHPGLHLDSVYPGLGVSKAAMATKLNMSRTTLWKFMKGKSRLAPDMAARLGEITDKSAKNEVRGKTLDN